MGQLSTENVLDDLKFVIDNKFDWFEIGFDWEQNFNLSDKTLNEIKKLSQENNVKLIVHTAWYLPVCTIIPEVKKAVIENIKKGIDIAKKVGSNRVTVHPGWREMPPPALDKNYNALIETLKELVNYAKKFDINICFENNDSGICASIEDYKKVSDSVKGIRMTFDVGHANVNDNPDEYFAKFNDRIMDVHIHDNGGEHDEHMCVGEGNIDFKKFFSECKKAKYNGPFILELFPYENILKGRERFLDIWGKL